ncbi:hypothetical protein P280DRAFT_554119 [Massarina eburnea CBS 473.64]|uniref:MYND-type domain-containing protein n=1 Tax=Massarina eburnea CBS 473.64 TaxID=1395130 RepID=A0A6A6RIV3_9PLEO|nr:hypothetical protein P280DRAFT_554119 [Massarina eburnea CBS 473.64]
MSTSSEAQNASSSTNEASSSSTPEVPIATCAQCEASPSTLKQCNKCHSVSYCNKDCQKAHYKTHKKECAKLAQAYATTHEPKMASRAPPKVGDRNTGYKKWEFDT